MAGREWQLKTVYNMYRVTHEAEKNNLSFKCASSPYVNRNGYWQVISRKDGLHVWRYTNMNLSYGRGEGNWVEAKEYGR